MLTAKKEVMSENRFMDCAKYFSDLQTQICAELERVDGRAKFRNDRWIKDAISGKDAGGGLTRVIQNGNVFEQGGVNFSEVAGTIAAPFAKQLTGDDGAQDFRATGISLVIHPRSPKVPTTHANLRYLEIGRHAWFGGGMDLTPYYLFEEDARYFHQVIKDACDRHDPTYYPRFKEECDKYFYLPHRGETRGVGGIFFDYLGRNQTVDYDALFNFVRDIGDHWCEMYVPIVEKRLKETYSEQEREFQLIRRGRYVEFNLLYDRGTKFGLETGGRTESILMSLPNIVRWEYDFQPAAGTPEAKLIEVLKNPQAWI